jgi:hypothetical protein
MDIQHIRYLLYFPGHPEATINDALTLLTNSPVEEPEAEFIKTAAIRIYYFSQVDKDTPLKDWLPTLTETDSGVEDFWALAPKSLADIHQLYTKSEVGGFVERYASVHSKYIKD